MILYRNGLAVALGWSAAGFLFGLSFVATPVKFLAEGVDLPQLLAVGRVTFRASALVELAILVAMMTIVHREQRHLAISAFAILVVQHGILLPRLEAQTVAVMHGAAPTAGLLHGVWIVCDIVRIVLYARLGLLAGNSAKDPKK